MLDETNRRSAIDFDYSDQFTNTQYFILIDSSKENSENLCSSIPLTSLRKTELLSTN